MTKYREVLDTFADTVEVIHFDGAETRSLGRGIHKHKRDIAFSKTLQERSLYAEGHDRYTVDIALQHSLYAKLHSMGVVIGGSNQDFVAILDRHIFKALNQLGEKRIGDLRNDEAQYSGPPGC